MSNRVVTDFDEIVDRTGTASEKWDRYRGRDVIPLWVADMDFRSPPAVIEALRARVEHGIFGYTHPPAELPQVIGGVLLRDYGWSIESDWIVWLPGLVTGLNVACRAVGRGGDEVLTAVPVYPPFMSAPRNSMRNVVPVPLAEDAGRWTLDFDALEKAVTPRSRLFLLCNPHNPTGRMYDREELARLAELCRRRSLFICSDEIHAGLALDQDKRHIPIATLSPETASRTITLFAPSKTFNIPGLGCAFAVIPDPGLRSLFLGAMEGIVPHVNVLGYTAALAAYRDGGRWLADLLEYLRGNRDLVEREIARMPGLAMKHVEATSLAWIDARRTGLADPAAFFEKVGVGLSDGAVFGGPGFVRLNFGCPRSILREALGRMAKAVGPASEAEAT